MALPRQSTPTALPSREELAAFVASATGKVGKREIARAFGVAAGDRPELKRRLKELEDEGILSRRGRRVSRSGELPAILPVTIVARDRDGELLAEPLEWAGNGPAPRITVIPGRRRGPRERPAGIGDRALLRIDRRASAEGGPAGRIQKMLPRERASALGVFKAHPAGGGRLLPVDKKAASRELIVPPGREGGAQDGDLVSVTIAGAGFGSGQVTVRERLGSLATERAVSLVAIHAHRIPHVFSAAALAEAEAARPATLQGREDWRALPLVTIDPPDAKDHDDAVHAAPDDDPANPGGHVVIVAIADVAA